MRIEKFDSLESTNKYCEALDLAQVEDFTCFWALEQTAGIGQRNNQWESEPGKNLTFSLVLHPSFLPADQQFKLTESLSLGVIDFLKDIKDIKVKWPNDIYVGGSKLCGTLVSTRLQGLQIASAVCGIGLNVNQTHFPDWVPNPVSLSSLTGRTYKLESLLQKLLQCMEHRYNELKTGCDPGPEYLNHLLNLGVPAQYRYKGEEITATISGVDPYGRLLLFAADGRHLSCGMKEVTLLA